MKIWPLFALALFPLALAATEAPTIKPDVAPRALNRVLPVYPPALKEQRLSGEVALRFVIDAEGNVTGAHADGTTNEEFSRAAVAAITQWKFAPGMKDGKPCAVSSGMVMEFSLTPADLAELEARRSKEVLPAGPPLREIGAVDEWPRLKKEIRPEIPKALADEKKFGEAVLGFVVDESGEPRDIHVVTSTRADCSTAAFAAVRRWRFEPARQGGQVVRVPLEVSLLFFPDSRSMTGLRTKPGVSRDIAAGKQSVPDASGVIAATPISRPSPEQPEEFGRRYGWGMGMEFIVDARGRVTHVHAIGNQNLYLATMMEKAFSHWRFRPATKDGAPVAYHGVMAMEPW